MKKIISLFFLMFLPSVVHSIDLTTGDDKGTIIVYRPMGLIGVLVPSEVMINQSAVVKLKPKQAVKFNLDPGTYILHSQTGTTIEQNAFYEVVKVDIKAGQTRYLRITPRMYISNKMEFVKTYKEKYKYIEKLRWVGGNE